MRSWSALLLPVILCGATAAFAVATLAVAQPVEEGRGPVPVAVTPADCRRLIAHHPAPDVAYRPGEDVYHRPVAPADLPGGPQIGLPQTITIDLTLDLAKRFGLPTGLGPVRPEASVGTITVAGSQVFFNGRPLQPPDQAFLAAACRRHER